MGYVVLAALGICVGLVAACRVWTWWRRRQDKYARLALYEAADRPFDFAFAAASPDVERSSERLLETPETTRSVARAAAEASSGGGAVRRVDVSGDGDIDGGEQQQRRWHSREALSDVQATQALIAAELDDDDDELPERIDARV